MNDFNNILKKYNIKPKKYIKKNNANIVITDEEKYVIKKRNKDKCELFKYLQSRSFNYFPELLNGEENDNFDLYPYIEDINISKEEKAIDIITLTSLLHSKTTHYKEIDIDDYKIIYEDLYKKLNLLNNYYNDMHISISKEIYMSPSQYLLVRNISKINAVISYCYKELDSWYELIKTNPKQRLVLIHNNLNFDHLLRGSNNYLISWDKAKVDIPIYDIYNFYKNSYDQISFKEILEIYEERYSFTEEEQRLLFILISMPDKVEFGTDEYLNTKKVNQLLYYIYKTDSIISPYYSNQQEEK